MKERLPPGAAAVLINPSHSHTDLFLPVDAAEERLFAASTAGAASARSRPRKVWTARTSTRARSSNGCINTTRSCSMSRRPRGSGPIPRFSRPIAHHAAAPHVAPAPRAPPMTRAANDQQSAIVNSCSINSTSTTARCSRPRVELAEAGARMFSAPGSWLAQLPGASSVAAGYELLYRLGKTYEKPAFGIRRGRAVDGAQVPVVEQTVLAKPFCRLLRFKRYSDQARRGRGAEARSGRAGRGAAVGPPRHAAARHRAHPARRPQGLRHRLDRRARRCRPTAARSRWTTTSATSREFIRHIGAERLHVIAVCQPAVPVLAATALMAAAGEPQPRSLTMMGGPIDARRSPTRGQRVRHQPLAAAGSRPT